MPPDVTPILDTLLPQIRAILADNLIGIYLTGSLAMNDYDPGISDIDLVAAIENPLDDAQFDALQTLHDAVQTKFPHFNNRIEVIYITRDALQTFRTETREIAIISPGVPFHFREADHEWLPNWYLVREYAVTLHGDSPQNVIPPITRTEYAAAVRHHMLSWREYIDEVDTRPYQAYAIITMCRGLYTCTTGDPIYKKRAAAWCIERFPQWASLIRDALIWRETHRHPVTDPAATKPITTRFVHFILDQIAALPSLNN